MSDWMNKRFWETETVVPVDGGFSVMLDKRNLRTPLKSQLLLPTRKMAKAIAAEWGAQKDKVDPTTMPVTRSANAAIDMVAVQHGEVAALIAAYGETDLLCYRADTPVELVAKQKAVWDPLLMWAEQTLSAPLNTGTGVMFVEQDPQVIASLHARVSALDAFQLAAFHDLVAISGSLIIAFAAIHKLHPIDVLWQASRIDEDWQVEQWGEDDVASATARGKFAGFEQAYRFYFMAK